MCINGAHHKHNEYNVQTFRITDSFVSSCHVLDVPSSVQNILLHNFL